MSPVVAIFLHSRSSLGSSFYFPVAIFHSISVVHHCHISPLQHFKAGHISGQNNWARSAGQHLQVFEPDRDRLLWTEIPRQCKPNGEMILCLASMHNMFQKQSKFKCANRFLHPDQFVITSISYNSTRIVQSKAATSLSACVPFKCLRPDLFVCQLVRRPPRYF